MLYFFCQSQRLFRSSNVYICEGNLLWPPPRHFFVIVPLRRGRGTFLLMDTLKILQRQNPDVPQVFHHLNDLAFDEDCELFFHLGRCKYLSLVN
jgi:hypothetical protein